MATKRPLVTKKNLRDLIVFVVVGAALVLLAGPTVKAWAMEEVFNPVKLDPYQGLRPGISVDATNVAAESLEAVSSFEWHTAQELVVVNDGGLTLGALRLDPWVSAPEAGKSTADATWVRVKQDGNLIMAETRLSEMKDLYLRVPAKGFAVGDKSTVTVEMKIDQGAAGDPAASYSFRVTPHMPFQPGMDHYEPTLAGRNPQNWFPNLGGHDTGL